MPEPISEKELERVAELLNPPEGSSYIAVCCAAIERDAELRRRVPRLIDEVRRLRVRLFRVETLMLDVDLKLGTCLHEQVSTMHDTPVSDDERELQEIRRRKLQEAQDAQKKQGPDPDRDGGIPCGPYDADSR